MNRTMPIKILIIDDSTIVHIILGKIIDGHNDIIIVGNAYNGREGIEMVRQLSPDVIIMDISMPEMNGLDAIQEIMDEKPTPIVVFSAASKDSIDISFKAIDLGAVELIDKPQSDNAIDLKNKIEQKLIKSIHTFHDFKVIRRIKKKSFTNRNTESSAKKEYEKIKSKLQSPSENESHFPVIGIAASTGGPQTIKKLISNLTLKKINAGIVIVQHMAEGFMNGFCEWLGEFSQLPVSIAKNGEMVMPQNIYIAPGEYHLGFNENKCFSYLDLPPIQCIRPSADIMFNYLAEVFKKRAIGIVLTGMGNDGTEGLIKIKKNGGFTISQDEKSSLIFGMPKSAIESGYVDEVLNIEQIPDYLETLYKERFTLNDRR